MHKTISALVASVFLSACGLERLPTEDEVRYNLGEPCAKEGPSANAPPQADEEFWLYCVYDGRAAGAAEPRWMLRPECPTNCEHFLRVRFQYGRRVEMRDPDGKLVGPVVRRLPDGAPVFGP